MNVRTNTVYDDDYEMRLEQLQKENTAEYERATDMYIKKVISYENTLGKPEWIKMNSKNYGNGDAIQVMLIEHEKNPDYYVAYYLTPAGYICIHRHITLDNWENLCSDKPAPEWFVRNAEIIKRKKTVGGTKEQREDVEQKKIIKEALISMLNRGVTWEEIEKNIISKEKKTFCPKELIDKNGRPTVSLTIDQAIEILSV